MWTSCFCDIAGQSDKHRAFCFWKLLFAGIIGDSWRGHQHRIPSFLVLPVIEISKHSGCGYQYWAFNFWRVYFTGIIGDSCRSHQYRVFCFLWMLFIGVNKHSWRSYRHSRQTFWRLLFIEINHHSCWSYQYCWLCFPRLQLPGISRCVTMRKYSGNRRRGISLLLLDKRILVGNIKSTGIYIGWVNFRQSVWCCT